MRFFGHIVLASGMSVELEKVEAVMSWERPKSVFEIVVSWDWRGITGGSSRISHDWKHL